MSAPDDYRTWKSWSAEGFGVFTPSDAALFAAEFSQAGVDLKQPNAVLELGFGNGQLAAWARRQGWTYIGTELDPQLVERARKAGFAAYGADTPLDHMARKDSLDLIVTFDVIEHLTLEEIVALLAGCRACLKPGGRLLARVPSGDSPFSGAIQHGDLTHKTAIGSGIVEQLALQTGFRVLQIREPAFPVLGLGPLRALRRGAITLARSIFGAVLRIVYYDNSPRVMTPNMVFVLQRSE